MARWQRALAARLLRSVRLTHRTCAVALTVALAMPGCTDDPTQVVVHVEADEVLLASSVSVRVRSCRLVDAPACPNGFDQTRSFADVPNLLPSSIPVGPPQSNNDEFWFEATLRDAQDQPLAAVRAIGDFVPETVRHVRLRFEAACSGLSCGPSQTCFQGACVDACVEASGESSQPSVPMACNAPFGDAAVDAGDASTDPVVEAPVCDCECGSDACDFDGCRTATPVQLIAAGQDHTCVGSTGSPQVWCWGENTNGKLGIGSDTVGRIQDDPALVALDDNLLTLHAGQSSTCATIEPGKIFCWGSNNRFRLGIDDPMVGQGNVPAPTQVGADFPESLEWNAVEVRTDHGCGITTMGRVYCWGEGEHGQVGVDPPTPMLLVRTPTRLAGIFTTFAVGNNFSCTLTSGGSPRCFGTNSGGQLGSPETVMMRAVPESVQGGRTSRLLTVGLDRSCAVSASDSEIRCWGANSSNRLGLVMPPDPRNVRVATPVNTELIFQRLEIGREHICGITQGDGRLFCWGDNTSGQLGVGDNADRREPTEVLPSGGWERVDAGWDHTCATRDDGKLYCWGLGSGAQLSRSCGRESMTTPCRVCLPRL
ncbi:MAG: hypothetical protein AAGF12_25340 [Myxococcota bacterium]